MTAKKSKATQHLVLAKESLVVAPVIGNASLAEFINAQSQIYAEQEGFVPTLYMEQEMALAPEKSAFFQSGLANYWLAKRGDRIVGRISAQTSKEIPVGLPKNTGMFGCFDVADDQVAARELLAAAEDWLVQQGCRLSFGPCTLDMNGEPGLLVEGQQEPRMILTPWHPSYASLLIEGCGYKKRKDLLSWRLESGALNGKGFGKRVSSGALGNRTVIRQLDKKNIKRDIQFICDIYNDAWKENELFVPLHPVDLKDLEKSLKPLLPPEACTFIEIDGEPAGVAVIIPNFFELTKDLSSRPGVIGWLKLGWRLLRHKFKSGRIILLGVSGRYKGTVKGMAIAINLVEVLLKNFGTYNGQFVEAGWVLEDNEALNVLLKRFGFRPSRRFRLYIKELKA
jgi:hypothetical protein